MTILSPPEFKRQINKYAGRDFMRKSILSIRDGAGVFEQLLGSGKYKRVLEIGTYRGVSSAYIAQFCDQVITIDLANGKMERDRQVSDRIKFWTALNISNINLRLVESDEEKAAVIKEQKFDFAFVDGDHSYDAVAADYELVKHCGAVLFHDFEHGSEVAKFIHALPKDEVRKMDLFGFWQRR